MTFNPSAPEWKCCCCLHVKTGALIIAFVALFFKLLQFIPGSAKASGLIVVLVIIIMIIGVICTILLIAGILMERRKLMLPGIIGQCVFVLILFLQVIIAFIWIFTSKQSFYEYLIRDRDVTSLEGMQNMDTVTITVWVTWAFLLFILLLEAGALTVYWHCYKFLKAKRRAIEGSLPTYVANR